MAGQTTPRPLLPAWVQLALGALVASRLYYHSVYLRDTPFGLATFSDGRQYELAAFDVLHHAPLGTKPFYLQGIYAYFMAVPMALRPDVSSVLLTQLLVAIVVGWMFFAAMRRPLGRIQAGIATVALLGYPMLAFYENKFLTAQLAVASMVLLLYMFARAGEQGRRRWFCGVGVAFGIAVLARPNMLVAAPLLAWAVVCLARVHQRSARGPLVVVIAGTVLALAPMSIRNSIVTGTATVFPAHGGGTSFYIGNNRESKGVWNSAGGLLTGDVSREREELVEILEIEPGPEAQQMAAIGRALYRRAFEEIVAEPGRWIALLGRKAWYLVGNDELTQDYDLLGERELVGWANRIGLPFAGLAWLGLSGLVALWRSAGSALQATPLAGERLRARAWAWVLTGLVVGVVAANLVYFTSSQHRLPLVVPLSAVAGLGGRWLVDAWRRRRWGPLIACVLFVGLSLVPRSKRAEPSAAFYYNLAVAYVDADLPREAIKALDRAVERRPAHPVIRIERATLLRRLGRFAAASADLDVLDTQPSVPPWVRQRARIERRRVQIMRDQTPGTAPTAADATSALPPTGPN